MLTVSQLRSLREHLERAQNPVFIYDNDADGLCSFLILRRFLGRGTGIAMRTHPDIDVGYAHTALAQKADAVFVLDCPFLGDAFVNELENAHVPIIWIDHHVVNSPHYSHPHVTVFNPARAKRSSIEPVTYWCYRATRRRADMWIALMGCVADHYLPSFSKTFAKSWPEFWKSSHSLKNPFDVYYGTEIGKLARALGFGLKDSITHVQYLQNVMIVCASPQDLLNELGSESSFARRFRDLMKRHETLLSEALNHVEEKVIFFSYGGTLSISADLANELCYRYPRHYVIVAYVHGAVANLSLRGEKVRSIFEKVQHELAHVSGGGHPNAVGARVPSSELERFKTLFMKYL